MISLLAKSDRFKFVRFVEKNSKFLESLNQISQNEWWFLFVMNNEKMVSFFYQIKGKTTFSRNILTKYSTILIFLFGKNLVPFPLFLRFTSALEAYIQYVHYSWKGHWRTRFIADIQKSTISTELNCRYIPRCNSCSSYAVVH